MIWLQFSMCGLEFWFFSVDLRLQCLLHLSVVKTRSLFIRPKQMEPPPSYSEVIANDLRNGLYDEERTRHITCSASSYRPYLVPSYSFSSRAWAPAAPIPDQDRSDEEKNRRVVSTIIMFIIIFAVIIIIAKLTEHARYSTPVTPRG
ncbi:hypothetical protein Tcan_14228 [Toxocara canis]|uniref:Uncharacterized protein n=1 Tax=Toxocara canis TaxID=6265 RepID=A0A0B2VNA2_TOXCA|nr:hypothetical protein Tcan_14228 [Toxocara canis]